MSKPKLLASLATPWLLGASGCSFVFMRQPPNPVVAPEIPTTCQSSLVPPFADLAGVGVWALAGLAAAVGPDGSGRSSGSKAPGVVMLGGFAALHGVSAVTGFVRAVRCSEFRALNERCVGGELEACRTLTPGWDPARSRDVWQPRSLASEPIR